MNLFTALLFGVMVGIVAHLWLLIIRICRAKQTVKINWNFKGVKVEDINVRGDREVVWTKKIAFDGQRIYLGYKVIGEKDGEKIASIPHACMAVVKDEGRVGVSLWTERANWNLHGETLKTIEETADWIVEDLIAKINPMYDRRLEQKFRENRMEK